MNILIKKIDDFLNRITMYRLVLYVLVVLVAYAVVLAGFGILTYNPLAILFSALFITTICLVTNMLFAWGFDAPTNAESVYITALILALIVNPISTPLDMEFFSIAIWASILAMASKYILAIRKKHIFNPAAIALTIIALTLNQSASWWVGTLSMFPLVLIGGILIVRKIQRFDIFFSFIIVTISIGLYSHITGVGSFFVGFFTNLWKLSLNTPLLFFAFIMLTEPLTAPPTRVVRITYGALVGILFAPNIHLGSIYFTPEMALVFGNIFSYIVSPKEKLILALKKIVKLSDDTLDFIFKSDMELEFKPGQYLEWTISNDNTVDARGNRRYFTISSSPTENDLAIGVKFYSKPSTFKQHLLKMKINDTIVASQLAGEFVLPNDKNRKMVFIAGGIGITPFRSMIKYLTDTNKKRDIIVLYSNKVSSDIAYKNIFDEVQTKLGIKTEYIITDPNDSKYTGRANSQMIESLIPDYLERYFYISGPRSIVVTFSEILREMHVRNSHIITDFFPGFA